MASLRTTMGMTSMTSVLSVPESPSNLRPKETLTPITAANPLHTLGLPPVTAAVAQNIRPKSRGSSSPSMLS